MKHKRTNTFCSNSAALRPVVVCLAVVIGVACLGLNEAQAQDGAAMRQKIESFTLKLVDLEKADEDQGALKEIRQTQLWLNDAQSYIVKEEEEVASKFIRRAEISIEMIEKLIVRAKEESKAKDRESAAVKMEKEANEASVKIQQAEAKKQQLQRETAPKKEPGS